MPHIFKGIRPIQRVIDTAAVAWCVKGIGKHFIGNEHIDRHG